MSTILTFKTKYFHWILRQCQCFIIIAFFFSQHHPYDKTCAVNAVMSVFIHQFIIVFISDGERFTHFFILLFYLNSVITSIPMQLFSIPMWHSECLLDTCNHTACNVFPVASQNFLFSMQLRKKMTKKCLRSYILTSSRKFLQNLRITRRKTKTA